MGRPLRSASLPSRQEDGFHEQHGREKEPRPNRGAARHVGDGGNVSGDRLIQAISAVMRQDMVDAGEVSADLPAQKKSELRPVDLRAQISAEMAEEIDLVRERWMRM